MDASEARRRAKAKQLADVTDVTDVIQAKRRQEIIDVIGNRADCGADWARLRLYGDEVMWLTLLCYRVTQLRDDCGDLYLVEW